LSATPAGLEHNLRTYADRQIEVTDFHRVKAISSRGGHDTFHLEAVDFLFLLQGPWFYS